MALVRRSREVQSSEKGPARKCVNEARSDRFEMNVHSFPWQLSVGLIWIIFGLFTIIQAPQYARRRLEQSRFDLKAKRWVKITFDNRTPSERILTQRFSGSACILFGVVFLLLDWRS